MSPVMSTRDLLMFDEQLRAAIENLVVEILRVVSHNKDSTSRALTIEDVMARTGMSRAWLYRKSRAKQLPFCKRIGRRFTYDSEALERWLERR
jgi:predicted DNA-binding transcriptional regulator AlpA